MKALAIFDNGFKSVRFVDQRTGEEIDARAVLTNLAYGRVKVVYTSEKHETGVTTKESWALEATGEGLL